MGGENQGGIAEEYENEVEVSLGIEDYIPSGKGNKPFWARGIDMLGYSLNSSRLSRNYQGFTKFYCDYNSITFFYNFF